MACARFPKIFVVLCLLLGLPSCGSSSDNAAGAGGSAGNPGGGGTGGIHLDLDAGPSPACAEAEAKRSSVGCEYFAARVAGASPAACFVAFVANTGTTAAHIQVEYEGSHLPVDEFAYLPTGSGDSLTYTPFDSVKGVAPGQGIILFLAGYSDPAGWQNCPVPAALLEGANVGSISYPETLTGIGKLFRITSDTPIVAYQMLPFGGGKVHDAGATLLIPKSAWDTSYIAVNAYKDFAYEIFAHPSMNLLAAYDDTVVTLLPVADVAGGGGIPAGTKGKPLQIHLNRAEQAQIHQAAELTGSVIESNKPIGLFAGHPSMDIPGGIKFVGDTDHGEQMIPPLHALGSEYVGVMYEPRSDEPALWRMVGSVDGTTLSWSSDVGGPTSLNQGQVAEFISAAPFIVKSQDSDHPFLLLQMMSGSGWKPELISRGGPDVVLSVPPGQFASEYVFFADPTFRNTHIVVVRAKKAGAFADVSLDCAGTLSGWQPIGDYEWTRIRLSQGDPYPWGTPTGVNGCNTGRHEIKSDAPFGITVWGWDDTTSYGYPGGMGVAPINDVVLPIPIPR